MTILIRGVVNNGPGCCKMLVASWGSACTQQPLHTALSDQVSADHTHEELFKYQLITHTLTIIRVMNDHTNQIWRHL